MPLHLVHGPPNSGRAGIIRAHFSAALERDPVLVVPTLDDVFSFEHELSAGGKALIGGSVLVFAGLFGEVGKAAGVQSPKPLSEIQRARLLRAAIEAAELGPLRRSARRPGFAAALDELIGELQAAMLSPDTVAAGASTLEGSAFLNDLAELYRGYVRLRGERGFVDGHTIAHDAIVAMRRDPGAWGGHPVFLYGFDDLTVEQRALIEALAEATEVTVSLTYEDSVALGGRARLYQQLIEIGADPGTATEADPSNTDSELLFHLERCFMRDGSDRMPADPSIALLRSAGDRGEAELIGSEIAALLQAGVAADEIALALRDPARRGPLHAGVLRGYGIPVALETEVPVAQSGTGSCLLALLRAAFTTRRASDLLTYLRGPRRAGHSKVDRLELAVRRGRIATANEAASDWERQTGKPPAAYERLLGAAKQGRLLAEVAAQARDIAQWPLATEEARGRLPESNAAQELRIGERIANAVEELAELEGLEPSAKELVDELDDLTIRSWTGPAEGRVRIASPYDLRAGRFRHLFVASLQDGEFPRFGSEGPFLTNEQRTALGMPQRIETEEEERYLFHVCLSLPTEGLHLSYRTSDEAGEAEPRSPFVDEVRRLLDPAPPEEEDDPLEAEITRTRGLGELLFRVAHAPSESELARTLAAAHASPQDLDPSLPAERGERLAAALRAATEVEEATREPGPLQVEAVIGELASVAAYGGTTLEGFELCSYRWFVDHELRPQPLEPDPEPLTQGGLMHRTLELLYREAPGSDALPRPHDLDTWIARGLEIAADVSKELSDHPIDRAMKRRIERLLEAFLAREAARENPRLRPKLFEARFGDSEKADKPRLDIGDWALHGQIDRVDVDDGIGLAFDYKLSREGTPVAKFEERGTLQLPLYLLALRELWGIDVAGGLYQPLRPTTDPRPRGLARKDEDGLLDDIGLVRTDLLEPDAFEEALQDAAARAGGAVARMRSGKIDRDPGPPAGLRGHDQCPKFCTYAPICRRERAPFFVPEGEDEEDEA